MKKILERKFFMTWMLFLNALMGVLVFIFPFAFNEFGRYFLSFGFIALFLAMWFYKKNLLFQSRLLILATIGYFAGLVKAIDPLAAFSPVGIDYQTIEVGAKMFGLTSIALFGAFLGLEVGFGRWRPNSLMWPGTSYSISNTRIHFYFATIIILIAGYLSARSYGNSVFDSGYASGTGQGQLLGNLQVIGVIAMVIAVTTGVRINKMWVMPTIILLGLYYFVWGILIRGGRIEVLSGLIAVFVALAAANGKIAHFNFRHYIIVFILAAFMEAWGSLRSTLSSSGVPDETIIEGYKRLLEAGIYHAGTISGIATTFSNMIHMVENSVVPYDYGLSYFNFLLRTPPEFLYPGRPQDLAWIFDEHGYGAIGGIFELAEAFYNFGLIGCFIVPFIISCVIGRTYKRAMTGNFLSLFILASILASTFRGGWYQTFAYYKSILTGLIIYFIFILVAKIFVKNSARVESKIFHVSKSGVSTKMVSG
jgi:hypothetical protein